MILSAFGYCGIKLPTALLMSGETIPARFVPNSPCPQGIPDKRPKEGLDFSRFKS